MKFFFVYFWLGKKVKYLFYKKPVDFLSTQMSFFQFFFINKQINNFWEQNGRVHGIIISIIN